MTEFISALMKSSSPAKSSSSEFILAQISRALTEAHLDHSQEGNEFSFAVPFYEFQECNELSKLPNMIAFGTIQYAENILQFSFVILDQNGKQIKAESSCHKIFLSKLCIILNKHNNSFHLKSNSLTGRFLFQCSYLIVEHVKLRLFISEAMRVFMEESTVLVHVLQFFEIVHPFKNTFLLKLSSKIDPLRTLILQVAENEKKQSYEQKCHEIFMISSKDSSMASLTASNSIEKMKRTYIDDLISMFVFNLAKIKSSNYSYLALDQTSALEYLLKTIDEPFDAIKEKHGEQTGVFYSNGREHLLNFTYTKKENVVEQYKQCETLTRKRNYFSFVKEYIVVRNHLSLSKSYVFTKFDGGKPISLKQFLAKNAQTMSLETRLKLATQILCIAFIIFSRIENFSPKLTCQNIEIDRRLCMKLKKLCKTDMHPKAELKQTLYKILFNKRAFYLSQNLQLKQNHLYSFVDHQNIISYGPSNIIKIILKAIQILDKDLLKVKEVKQNSKDIQSLLLIITRVSDVLQKQFSPTNKQLFKDN